MRKNYTLALLSLLATILVAALSFAGLGNNSGFFASAFASSALSPAAPDATWTQPIFVSNELQYDNSPHLSAAPLDGSAQVIWTRSENNTAEIVRAVNHTLGGPFDPPQVINSSGINLVDTIGDAHDSASHTDTLTWKYQGQNVCDYYKQFDKNGNLTAAELVPGSCNAGTPRKIGAIAVDANLTVHILLGRNSVPGSMRYWERTGAGVWTVQGEALPAGCAPTDPALAVTTQGKVMAAWKDCGVGSQGTDIFTGVRVAANNWQVDDISASCCSDCPNISGAYLPHLAADPTGGIRAVWADGRCPNVTTADIYYREWTSGTGWNGHPIVQVVSNSGNSYYPDIAVDSTGEAHIVWGDDTNSPFAYYQIFYSHGHGTVFSAPQIPLTPGSLRHGSATRRSTSRITLSMWRSPASGTTRIRTPTIRTL